MTTTEFPHSTCRGWVVFFMGLAAPERPWIPTKAIVALMKDVGYEVTATRVTLSRMYADGWVERRTSGRESSYRLGRVEVEDQLYHHDHAASFGADVAWDGTWTVLVASLPENRRPERYHLRHRLSMLGFGRLRENAWWAVGDREDELKEITEDLALTDDVFIIMGWPSSIVDVDALLHDSWDLSALADGYRSFASKYAHLRSAPRCRSLTDHDAVMWWMRLTHDYRTLIPQDPRLPDELLPADASQLRSRAVATFASVDANLRPTARRVVLDRFGVSA